MGVFKLNVEAHPDSSNVYDSLAETYMNRGERDLAIKNYEKSLELNPKNLAAAAALAKLSAEKWPDGPARPAWEQSEMAIAGAYEFGRWRTLCSWRSLD